MQISYIIPQAKKDKLAAANPATLSLMRLLYHHTQGVVKLCCAKESLELYVPVFDFAWCLLYIAEMLQTDSSAVFGDTESADIITFRRTGEMVSITPDFSEWRCQIPYLQLRASVGEFAQAVVDELCEAIPELQANPTIKEAYKKLAANSVQEQAKDTRE